MKTQMIFLACLVSFFSASAQRVVFDSRHFAIVNENAIMRNAAELSHQQLLSRISTSLENANINAGVVVAAQAIIYSSLTNINSALKNGLMLRNMEEISSDILQYSSQAVELSKSDPVLLLFAEQMFRDMALRGTRLMGEVSAFLLKNGDNLLMDHNSRDMLMKKISTQLHVISGLAYGAWRAMYYAKARGVFARLNPFASFVDRDKAFVNEIIANAKYLRK